MTALFGSMALAAAFCALGAGPGQPEARLAGVRSWGYQLQGSGERPLDLGAVRRSPFDLVVIDYANNGAILTSTQVARLKTRRRGRHRKVIAYMSIGEAEDYRFYWRAAWKAKPPAFMAPENDAWPGNFKVRYWMPGWQQIIVGGGDARSYLDRIIDAGFDGIYLDIIDAFEHFGPEGPLPERSTAATDMAELVIAIARHARVTRGRPDFAVIPQNGPTILFYLSDTNRDRYLDAVDGIGVEDTFYYGDNPENNRLDIQWEAIASIRKFREADKVVLAVDYLTSPRKARNFIKLARRYGFIPYVGRRELDRLVIQPE